MDAKSSFDIRIAIPSTAKYQPNPPYAPQGLFIIPDWIDENREQEIVNFLCTGQWSDHISGKRLTQHFGYRYTISGYSSSTEKLATDWGVLKTEATRLEETFPGIKIAQCLANMYTRDTGISAHRDKETPIVFGLSLVGDINMIWSRIDSPSTKYEAFIPRRSLYIMTEDAALLWKHEVPVRKSIKYPDAAGNLTQIVKKPDAYVRVSITYRHFDTNVSLFQNNNVSLSLPPNIVEAVKSAQPPPLEICHLQSVIPRHAENFNILFNEHPWQKFYSRMACHESNRISISSAIYGQWLKLFCDRILNCSIEIDGAFANLYENGDVDLPAHSDKQYGCWVFGLSFGETRTFDFIANGVGAKSKTGDIVSLEMKSGDLVYFSPSVNNTHKHRILKEKNRPGRRINITYFVKPTPTGNQSVANLLNPPELNPAIIPTYEEAIASMGTFVMYAH